MRDAMTEYQQAGQVFHESGMSVADYFGFWKKNYVDVSLRYNTQQLYSWAIEKHITPALGSLHLKSLNPALIQDFLNRLHQSGMSRNSIRAIFGVITKALNMAVYPYQYLRENPANYASIPRAAKKKRSENLRVITAEDFKVILDRYPSHRPRPDRGTSYRTAGC